MKSVVALLLSVLVLASSLLPRHDLAELSRLPQLLEHYRQHRQATGGTMSFEQFLALHYSNAGRQAHGARHTPEHEGLPLHDCHHAPVPAVCAAPVVWLVPAVFRAWPTVAYKPAEAFRCPGGHSPTRWQPPCA